MTDLIFLVLAIIVISFSVIGYLYFNEYYNAKKYKNEEEEDWGRGHGH